MASTSLRFLQIGHYKLSIAAQGFGSTEVGPFNLEVGQEAKVDAKLKVGSVNENIVVIAAAPILNSENPSTGTSITAQQATELPLQARNFCLIFRVMPWDPESRISQFAKRAENVVTHDCQGVVEPFVV